MAKKQRRKRSNTYVVVSCPSCGQKLGLWGLMVQEESPMACAECNTLFKLKFEGDRAETVAVAPPTGRGPGPAEGPNRF